MTSQVVTLVLFLSLYIASATRQQRICMQLESVDVDDHYGAHRREVQTIPGKKGPKGERGPSGQKGSEGVVDYDRLEELVNQKIKKAMEKHRREMNETIKRLEKKIELLQTSPKVSETSTTSPEILTTSSSLPEIPSGFTERDVVRYDGKIFIPMASEKVRKDAATTKCQSLGGQLANVYSQSHMDKLMQFIRDNKLGGYPFKGFWLGMIYDTTNRILRLRDGVPVSTSDYKWHSCCPRNRQHHVSYTSVFITVQKDPSTTSQYLFNFSDIARYVLCEF